MKIQIKTANPKPLVIEIEESKTISDLKKELALYADIGVQPDYQQLSYNGKVLKGNDQLKNLKMGPKKFISAVILKKPYVEEDDPPSTSASEVKAEAEAEAEPIIASPNNINNGNIEDQSEVNAGNIGNTNGKKSFEEEIQNIVSMGYSESSVREALKSCFNNVERALDYLIDGPKPVINNESIDDADWENGENAHELFRYHPLFQDLIKTLRQNPDQIHEGISRIIETNPSFLEILNMNRIEFTQIIMDALNYESDDEDSS